MRQRDIVARRLWPSSSPSARRSRGSSARPCAPGVGGAAQPHGLAVERRRRPAPPTSARVEPLRAGAGEARDAENLAAPQFERNVVAGRRRSRPSTASAISACRRRVRRRRPRVARPPVISAMSCALLASRGRQRRSGLAVAQHGDAVGEREHFVEPMRDIDHAAAARAQGWRSSRNSRSASAWPAPPSARPARTRAGRRPRRQERRRRS